MFLKYLAVEGFKSFPEWNGLELMPGVNVLVGPNGTGKSNLTDAVSWVLGEEDRSALRATGAAALVFAGTEELNHTESAHVTVVLDERPSERLQDGARVPLEQLKHGQQAKHTGICPPGALTITRELTRVGDDRFMIDGRAASRGDVRVALAAAGVAFPPVATIRQGELERILVLDPAERRRVVEQVVGIPELSERLRQLDEEHAESRIRHEHLLGERDEATAQVRRLHGDVARLETAQALDTDIAAVRAAVVEATLSDLAAAAGRSAEHAAATTGELLDVLGLSRAREGTCASGLDHAAMRALLDERLAALDALGTVTPAVSAELEAAESRLASIEAALARVSAESAAVGEERRALSARIADVFSAATARIDQRFRRYYGLLAPDGEAALRLTPAEGDTPSGVEVVARPPGKVLDRIDALSGGERSLAALSFALALFQEARAPFFILDEVEPALDDSNIRRLQAVLDLVADERQLLLVSHQQRAKETGDVVFGVERNLDGASQVKFRYEPGSRRLEVFRRTWAADHLRRTATEDGPPRSSQHGQVSVGTAGSPTQPIFAELFGPASGASRAGFHDDGTFRGIWDAMRDTAEAGASSTETTAGAPDALPPRAPAGGAAIDDADETPPAKTCC